MAGKNDSVISDLLSGFQSSGGKGRAKTSQDSHDHSAHATKQATASSGGAAGQPNARPGFEVPEDDEPRRAGSGNREPSLNPIQNETGSRSENSGVSLNSGGSSWSRDGVSVSDAATASQHSSQRHSSTGHSENAGSMKTAMDRGGSSIRHDGANISDAVTSSQHSSSGHSATAGSSKDTSSSHSTQSAHINSGSLSATQGAGGGGASSHEGHSTSSGSSTHSSGHSNATLGLRSESRTEHVSDSLSRQENTGRSVVNSSSEGTTEAGTRYRTTERDDGSVTKEREAYRVEGDFTYTHKEAVSRNAAGEEFSTVTDTTYNATTGERSSKIITTSAEGESRLSVSETISANDKGGVLHRTIERDDGSITKEREAFTVDGNVAKTHTESHTRNADGSELVSITKSEREVAEQAPGGAEQGGALMVSERSSSISSHSIEEIAPHLAPASHFEPQTAEHGAESKLQVHEQGTAHAVTSGQLHDKSEVAVNHTQAQSAASATDMAQTTSDKAMSAGAGESHNQSATLSPGTSSASMSSNESVSSSKGVGHSAGQSHDQSSTQSHGTSMSSSESVSSSKGMDHSAGQSHDQSSTRSHGTSDTSMRSTESVGSSKGIDHAASQAHVQPSTRSHSTSDTSMSSTESVGSSKGMDHAASQAHVQSSTRSQGISATDMTQSSGSSQTISAGESLSNGAAHGAANAPSQSDSREGAKSHQPTDGRGGADLQDTRSQRSPSLEKAIEQHIEKHGLSEGGAHAKEMATGFAAAALSQIGELKSNGGDLSQSELNVATGVVQPWMSSGPHGVSLETLDVIAQKGLSPEGLHELTAALGGEAAGLSNLQLAERVGPDVIEQMGEKGFPAEKLAAVQELAASLGDAVGVKDVSLTKLEGLDVLKEINAPNNAESVLFAEAKSNGEVSMGTMSKDDFSKNPEMAGAAVKDINDALAGLDRNQAQERAAAAESKHEQAEMSMSMSMAA